MTAKHYNLAFRTRADVLASGVWRAESGTWVVGDPLSLEHFELTREQWFVAQQLSGTTSLDTLRREFEKAFAPDRVELAELWHLVGELHRRGIVVATGPGQAEAFATRRGEQRSASWRWGWLQVLAWRLPGFAPQGAIDFLYPFARPLLSRLGFAASGLLIVLAVGLVATRFDQFGERLPTVSALWTPEFMWAAIATICVVKALHELGHALVARHLGVDVSEIGIMLLCGMPTLYCDVSGAWRLPRRRDRMAISAAGIAVEMLLAAMACFVWWFARPGVVQTLALCVMSFASIGTLLVNGNPLLRYDGYYLLSDITGVSNLWQRSRDALRQWTIGWLRKPLPGQQLERRESPWLALYGGASQVYLTILLGSIALVAWRTLAPRDLDVLAYGAGTLLVAATVVSPIRRLTQTLRNPLARRRVRWIPAGLSLVFATALAASVWQWPIRHRIDCPARVELSESEEVVATLAGRLVWAVEPHSHVYEGDTIARLLSDHVELDVQAAASELALAELKLQQLQQLRPHDAEAAAQIPTAESQASAARTRLGRVKAESARLTITAPSAGKVLKPAARDDLAESLTLATWNGTPLDSSNEGAWIEPGDTLAIIAREDRREVRLGIAEREVQRVAERQPVRLALEAMPNRILTGTIVSISKVAASQGSESHVAGSSHADNDTRWRTSLVDQLADQARYEAVVELDEPDDGPCDGPCDSLAVGSRGWAKVEVGRTTVGASLMRWVRGLFAID